MSKTTRGGLVAMLVALVLMPAASAAANQGANVLGDGRALYRGVGGGALEQVAAFVGAASSRIPAHVVPCAGCHGRDGLGGSEGGVQPPPVLGSILRQPATRGGHARPGYSLSTFARLLSTGVDPAGRRLDPTMPRSDFSMAEAEVLWQYLARIDEELDPGLTTETVRLATVLTGPRAMATAVEAVVRGLAADVNAAGGVHGRRIVLQVKSDLRRPADSPFAFVATHTPGQEPQLQALIEKLESPLVGPIAWRSIDTPARSTHVFHLIADARLLVEVVSQAASARSRRIAVVWSDPDSTGLVGAPAPVRWARASLSGRSLVDAAGHGLRRTGRATRPGCRRAVGRVPHAALGGLRPPAPAVFMAHRGPAVNGFVERYLEITDIGRGGIRDALSILADSQRRPLAFHCRAGKDRTGVLAGLLLSLLGVSDDDIDADYALSNIAFARFCASSGRDPVAAVRTAVTMSR